MRPGSALATLGGQTTYTGLRFLLRKAGENPCLSPVLTGNVLAPGEVHLTGSARLCLPANRCKRAQVKSCTECIRVDRECAYCTDEVSFCRLPTFLSPVPTRLPHPTPPCPTLRSGPVHTRRTLSPASGQAGVEQARVRRDPGLGQPGDGHRPP